VNNNKKKVKNKRLKLDLVKIDSMSIFVKNPVKGGTPAIDKSKSVSNFENMLVDGIKLNEYNVLSEKDESFNKIAKNNKFVML